MITEQFPLLIEAARGDGDVVSLTFDDGPNPADTHRLLDVLRGHDVRAVFCLQGDQVERHPETVRRIVADGHTLCNHSMHHDDMSTWTPERIAADLRETDAAIRRALPHARIPYFRAPYGAWGQSPAVAAALGMRPLGWRLAVADWETPAPTSWCAAWRRASRPGRSCSCTTAAATAARPSTPSTGSSRS
ncbi:polysaccharide deacetylase family protein [Catellatospora coxensis]